MSRRPENDPLVHDTSPTSQSPTKSSSHISPAPKPARAAFISGGATLVEVGAEAIPYDRDHIVPSPAEGGRSFGRMTALLRMRRYLYPYKKQLAIMFSSAILGTLASITVPLITKQVIDGPIAHNDQSGLWPLGLLALLLGVIEAFLMFVRRWTQSKAVLGLETQIRDDLYAHLQSLPMSFHGRWQSGQLLSRATTDLSIIRRFLGFGIVFLVTNVIQVGIVTVLLLHMYWPLGVVVLLSNLPIIWASKNFHHGYIKVSRQVQDQQGDLATLIEEGAVGIRVAKAFGRRDYLFQGYDKGARHVRETSLTKVRMSARFWTLLGFVPNMTLVVVMLAGAIAAGRGHVTLGSLVAFMTLMLQLVWPIQSTGQILAMAQESMTGAERVMEVFDTKSTVVGGTKELREPNGRLKFEGVAFRFTDSDTDTLNDLWLEVEPGQTVAVVGATGSGKTTLTSLVPRLQDVRRGRITIDGVDVRELTLTNLRGIVSTAFEDPTLFSMSVRENLTLGRFDATDEDVREALEVAQATFAYDLPWGLATRVGEQGLSLSGGQRQRLALARAVVARPKILVLDDTMSALDVETEALVEAALGKVLAQSTGIIVAHRASTVLLADKVALLQHGTITHVGEHHELLATVPAYRDLLAADMDGPDGSPEDADEFEEVSA